MKFNNKENPKFLVDGKTYYHSRSVAVVGTVCCIMNNIPYFLISKRGKGAADFHGKYNITCGYLDWSENTSGATTREIWEECKIDLTKITNIIKDDMKYPWDINSDLTQNRENVVIHHGLIALVDELPTTNIHNHVQNDEVEEVVWCSIYDYRKYDFCFNHNDRIEKYIEKYKWLFRYYHTKNSIIKFLMKLI